MLHGVWKGEGVHVGGELAKRLVKVVHLCQDANCRDDHEHVG